MSDIKTRAIEKIERKMSDLDSDSLRYRVLETSKNFKTSWINLGQALYTVWKDKCYKEWGFSQFDSYTSKDIGIRKDTAMKLLKSYYFLEKENAGFITKSVSGESDASKLPSYEAVDVLRKAANRKDIDKIDYERMKKSVFESGKDAKDVRATLTQLVKQREELEPEEARMKKRVAVLRRMVGSLKSISKEARILKVLPAQIINDTEKLISKIEAEIR